METLKTIRNIILGFFTVICVILLFTIIFSFGVKKASEEYFNEKKIKQAIKNINVVEILKDRHGKEDKVLETIKNKLTESGIKTEFVEDFLNTKPVNEYTGDKVSILIDNIIKNKKEKLVSDGEIYEFLNNNIADISKELQEKNIPNSDVLTQEYQEEFLNKVKDKTPDIEEKINELQDKIFDKLGDEYSESLEKYVELAKFIYNNLLDLIFIILGIIFIIGIIITRRSIYKSLKWIGISFIGSSMIFMLIPRLINKAIKHINDTPKAISDYIKTSLTSMKATFTNEGIICLIIGIVLIILNIVIYIILEKIDNRRYEKNL